MWPRDAADAPADAIRWTGQVKEGDIIVAGSDGLFDNLEVDTVVEQVSLWEACVLVPTRAPQSSEPASLSRRPQPQNLSLDLVLAGSATVGFFRPKMCWARDDCVFQSKSCRILLHRTQ